MRPYFICSYDAALMLIANIDFWNLLMSQTWLFQSFPTSNLSLSNDQLNQLARKKTPNENVFYDEKNVARKIFLQSNSRFQV